MKNEIKMKNEKNMKLKYNKNNLKMKKIKM